MFKRVVLQAEAAECGLACLATVAGLHGRAESLSELRRRFPMSLGGTTLKDLIDCADRLGFSARPIRCDLDELSKLDTPAILHWSLDHYVVLLRVSRKSILIADPARGERTLSFEEASRHFTGIALELTPAPHFEKRTEAERVLLSDLWGRLTGFKPFLAQMLFLTLMLQVVALLTPLANQIIIDDVIARGDRELLAVVLLGFAVLILIQTAIQTLRGFIQLHAGQRLSIHLSGNLLKHLLRLQTAFFERRHVGDVLSRFSSLQPVQAFLTNGLVGVALDAAMVIPVAVVMVLYSPLLSGLVVLNLVVVFAVRAAAFPRVRRYAEELLNLSARTESVFLETVRGARAIKIAAREPERHSLWQNTVADQQNVAFQQGSFALWGGGGAALWVGLNGIVVMYLGALQVIEGSMTLGMFFAFQTYAAQFSTRINNLIAAVFSFRMLGLHLERLADIVHADPETDLDGTTALARPITGKVEARSVSFRYGEYDAWVLRDVNFSIERGEAVAIVGPSGGGKSTLLKIMMGVYEPTEGQIVVDGYPLRVFGLRAFRSRIGVVMQDDQLLSGSIADNVAFFDPNADQDRVEQACQLAHIHDDIMRMPMGYHSLIGDMGSILSGGQKQRLLLARALYKQPTILFMDEGTANLDPELERRVMNSIADQNITRIMVAHRQAAIRGAGRILLVERGSVTEITGAAPRPPADASETLER